MHTRQLVTALGLTASLAAAHASAAAADPPAADAPRTVATMEEDDCFEGVATRGVVTAAVDAVVPDRVGLATTPTTSLTIITYTCRALTVDRGAHPHRDTTTVSIGAVGTTSLDGVPTSGYHGYVLWYGTDDPRLFSAMRSSGMPATFLHGSTATLPPASAQPGSEVTVAWDVRGHDVEYDLAVRAVEPAVEPTASDVSFLHVRPDGRIARLDIHNREAGQVTSTSTTAQLAGIDALQPLLTDPRFNTVPQPGQVARFPYLRGSWSSVLTVE